MVRVPPSPLLPQTANIAHITCSIGALKISRHPLLAFVVDNRTTKNMGILWACVCVCQNRTPLIKGGQNYRFGRGSP